MDDGPGGSVDSYCAAAVQSLSANFTRGAQSVHDLLCLLHSAFVFVEFFLRAAFDVCGASIWLTGILTIAGHNLAVLVLRVVLDPVRSGMRLLDFRLGKSGTSRMGTSL